MLKAVFFDFDGTLAKTEEGYLRNYKKLIERTGFTFYKEDEPFLVGKGTILRSEYLNEKYGYGIDGESLRKEFRKMNEEMFTEEAGHFMYEDVIDCLNELKKEGLRLYLCTNTKRDLIEYALEKMGIGSYFEDILSGQDPDVMVRKPDPELYRILLRRSSLEKEEAVVIEDSPGGVEAAKGAGILTVGLTRIIPADVLQADIAISSLKELPDILKGLSFDSHMNS